MTRARLPLLTACLFLIAAGSAAPVPPNAGEPADSPAASLPVVIVLRSQQISLDPLHSYSATEAQLYTGLYEGLVSFV